MTAPQNRGCNWAREAVEELRRYGGWKELDEEAPKTAGTRMISSESWEVKPD